MKTLHNNVFSFRNVRLLLMAACLPLAFFLFLSGPAHAENIVYPGVPLQPGIFGPLLSIYPAGANSLAGNTATINGGPAIPGSVVGGLSATGQLAAGNQVFFNGGETGEHVIGGLSGDFFFNAVPGLAEENQVTISGGLIKGKSGGGVALMHRDSISQGNSWVMTGGRVEQDVFGGYSHGAALNNNAALSGGSVGWAIAGGFASIDAGGTGNAQGNSVTVSGGSVGGGAAMGVLLPFAGVYGGYSAQGEAIHNIVSISGNPDLSQAWLYGGFSNAGLEAFTGNTLNINGFRGSLQGIANFQNYNFALPASLSNGQTLLSLANPADLSNANITLLGIDKGGTALQVGDSLTLIDATSGVPAALNGSGAPKGLALLYDFDLSNAGGALTATVSLVQAHPRAKPLSEGQAARLAFINQGADLLLNQGIGQALVNAPAEGLGAFGAASGGFSRYATGSHVDVSGFSMLAGLAFGTDLGGGAKYGRLTLGAFFEGGWGSYDSYNSFSNYADVDGKGDTDYVGGGILARFDCPGGGYLEASARLGRAKADFSSSDLGQHASYDSSSLYWGAHGGLGYVWRIDDKASLDMYAKYIFTRQESDSVTILGDDIDFAAADSQRARVGARFGYAVTERVIPYLGVAYEYEFDGDIAAKAYGHSLDEPSLKGGSGVFDVGLAVRPVSDGEFVFELGAQGYVGTREGVTGSLQMRYDF